MSVSDRIRVKNVRVLSDNYATLKDTTFEWRRSDGEWQTQTRETFDRGANMDEAVRHGIKSTAGVVTSAAIVMVCVFAVFGTLSAPFRTRKPASPG